MPLNESTRKSRRRFPVEFDLEGVPQDSTLRQQLLEQKQQQVMEQNEMAPVKQVTNFFAVDTKSPQVIDINDPKTPRYGTPQNPRREYPKMVYHHETGRVLAVQNQAQYEAAKRREFKDQPDPKRDYSNVRPGMVAPVMQETEPREHVMTVEELEELEAAELASLNEEENQQSEEDAEAEIAAQLGEAPARPTRRKRA